MVGDVCRFYGCHPFQPSCIHALINAPLLLLSERVFFHDEDKEGRPAYFPVGIHIDPAPILLDLPWLVWDVHRLYSCVRFFTSAATEDPGERDRRVLKVGQLHSMGPDAYGVRS